MAINTCYNLDPVSPAQITREEYTDVGSSPFQLGTAARNFLTGTDFEIWTAASGGTQLTENTDYELSVTNTKLLSKYGVTCKTRVTVTNATYQTGSIFITYKVVSSETDAEYFNELNTTDISLQSQIDALGGGITVVKTSDYTILDDDTVNRIEVDTTSADVTITMPLIANNSGRKIEIIYVKGGTNKVIIVPNATDATKITNDDLAVIWLPKINDHITLQHSTSSGFWESNNERITSQLRLNTYAGYGDINNSKIMRFTNVTENVGNLFSENHVSGYNGNTEGLEITINRSGKYGISFTNHPAGTQNVGLSLNSSQLTTNIYQITNTNIIAMSQAPANIPANVSVQLNLKKNDVVRPHLDGVGSTTYAANSVISVSYLGN